MHVCLHHEFLSVRIEGWYVHVAYVQCVCGQNDSEPGRDLLHLRVFLCCWRGGERHQTSIVKDNNEAGGAVVAGT